ncbi:MAG: HDOD domain-containing protein [candidate division Zixibacteria bacterium]|nr:HDOD domain-containing protein [candidate division Zixibacteria bacterium]
MNKELFEKILDDHKELSSLPQTLTQVIKVVKDESSSVSDLAEVLIHDPALVTKILRVVNSPFYGATREVTTISQAVMTLGMRAVSALALSTSIYNIAGKWDTSIDRIRFWRHSLEVAVASRDIAEAIKYECPEEAFIAGLIHDIGLLIIEKSFPEKFSRIWKQAQSGENIFELEDRTWGTNHARVGRFLLEQWHLPESICEAVGLFQNEFPPGNIDPDFRLPQIVSLATRISRFSVTGLKRIKPNEQENIQILIENINLDKEKLVQIQKELMNKTAHESEFLEMEIGSSEELLQEANRMLYEQYLTVENLLEENQNLYEQIAQEKLQKAALEALRTITATLNHYVNNAIATILGRAQLVQICIDKGQIVDSKNTTMTAMIVIENSVKTITSVMEELKKLTTFETIIYHDDTYIIDIENKIKKQFEEIEKITSEECVTGT